MLVFAVPGGQLAIDEKDLERLRERIVRFGRSHGAGDDAEDFAHDTLMLVAKKYPGVQSLTDLVPLAIRTMQLKMMDRRRAQFRHGDHVRVDPADLQIPDPGPRPDEEFDTGVLIARMATAIRSLGPECSELLRLRMLGFDTQQIIHRMGIKDESTVNMRVFHCRKRLRALMENRSQGAKA